MFGGLFKKKEQKVMSPEKIEAINEGAVLDRGVRGVKDLFAPGSYDRSSKYHIRVNEKYAQSFVMDGFPATVSVGWLDILYSYSGDMDVMLHIEPRDQREVLDEITHQITQASAQLITEEKRGNIKNMSALNDKIHDLTGLKRSIERGEESLFQTQIATTLYTDTEEDLNKETAKLQSRLRGQKIKLSPAYLRQDEGYKTVLPIGRTYIPDKFRNMSVGALMTTFPFYNSEISHDNGILVGLNLQTNTPIFMDFYNRSLLNNSNVNVFGKAGSGKTYFVSTITLRSAAVGVRSVIIDPEGEYKKVTDAVNGSYITIATDSPIKLNPFDLESEVDDDTGEEFVNIREKVADVLNLISVMAGTLSPDERAVVAAILNSMYEDAGFTESPESLYDKEVQTNEQGDLMFDGVKKPMPTFTDFHEAFEAYIEQTGAEEYRKLVNSLAIYKKGGIYDLFDGQTSKEIEHFMDAPIVTFDISSLEENILRPIGMYVALSWAWEKFAKKNPEIRKRVIVDEAWMLLNPNMEGHEYTAQFLETSARRIRKRNGGLLVASQNFTEFESSPQGQAVLTNSTANIFLQQASNDIEHLQQTFQLSEGESSFLKSAQRGELLIRLQDESVIARSFAFPYEHELITDPYNVQKRQREAAQNQ